MNLTLDVKNKGLVMPTKELLTFDVMSEVKSSADIRKEFGRYMQSQRESKGISQKYIADKIGKTVTQVSRIENGKSGTERDTVIEWAKALGINENEALRQFKPENTAIKKPINVAEFFEILDNLGLDVQFHGGFKMLETLDEEDLQELLDGVVANASAKVKRKMQGKNT